MSLATNDQVIITYPNGDVVETLYSKTMGSNKLLLKHNGDFITIGWNGKEWFLVSEDDDENIPVTIDIIRQPSLKEEARTMGYTSETGITASTLTDIQLLITSDVRDFPNFCQTNKNIYLLCNNPKYDSRIYKERFIKFLLPMFGKDGTEILEKLKFPISFLDFLPDISVLSEQEIQNTTVSNWKDVYNAFAIIYNSISKRELRSINSLAKVLERTNSFVAKVQTDYVKRQRLHYFIDASEKEKIFNTAAFLKLMTLLDYLAPDYANQSDDMKRTFNNIVYSVNFVMAAQYNVSQLLFVPYYYLKPETFNVNELIDWFTRICSNVRDIYDFNKLYQIYMSLPIENLQNEQSSRYIPHAVGSANMEVLTLLQDKYPNDELPELNSSLISRAITKVLTHPVISDDDKILALNEFLKIAPINNYTFNVPYSNLSQELYLWLIETGFKVSGAVLQGYAENDDIEMTEFLMAEPFNLKPTIPICRRSGKYSTEMKLLLNCTNEPKIQEKYNDEEIRALFAKELNREFETDEEFRQTILEDRALQGRYQRIIDDRKYRRELIQRNQKKFGKDTAPVKGDQVVLKMFDTDMTFYIINFQPSDIIINNPNYKITLTLYWNGVKWVLFNYGNGNNIPINDIRFL